ncbi:hypothetical protein Plhal304r1_c056g0142031 [Plasmopara halstedii]
MIENPYNGCRSCSWLSRRQMRHCVRRWSDWCCCKRRSLHSELKPSCWVSFWCARRLWAPPRRQSFRAHLRQI